MKKKTAIIVGSFAFIFGYFGGHIMKTTTVTMDDYLELRAEFGEVQNVCPDEKNCQVEVITVRNEMESKFQEALLEREIQCSQWAKCTNLPGASECDCTIDFEEGVIEGKRQAVEENKMYSGSKKKIEYCDEHYCQEKILRRTRPITE